MQSLKRISAAALVGIAALASVGCANTELQVAYYEYLKSEAEARKAVGVAQAQTESLRYIAAAKAVESADSSAKAAAAVTLGIGAGKGAQTAQANTSPRIQAPETTEDKLFKWASLITGAVVPAWQVDRQTKRSAEVAIVQSNNSASVQKDTNSTMLGLGLGSQAIQAASPLEFSGAGLTVSKPLPPVEEIPAE